MRAQQCLGEVLDTGTAKGRGIFARHAIRSGEVVESAPIVMIEELDFDGIPEPVRRLLFNWSILTGLAPGRNVLALGYGSLYNHAQPANLRYAASIRHQTLVFSAARDISAGEELTVNYNFGAGEPDSDDNTWFDNEGLRRL